MNTLQAAAFRARACSRLAPKVVIPITDHPPPPKPVEIKRIVSPDLSPEPPIAVKSIPLRHIAAYVCAKEKISLADLISSRRDVSIVRPRQIAHYLSYKLSLHSLITVGKWFHRDHTSILHSKRTVEQFCADDQQWAEKIRAYTADLMQAYGLAEPVK